MRMFKKMVQKTSQNLLPQLKFSKNNNYRDNENNEKIDTEHV